MRSMRRGLNEHCLSIAMSTRGRENAQLTLTFIEVGARAVISLFILSAMPGNIVVPACTTFTCHVPTQQGCFDTQIRQYTAHAPKLGEHHPSWQTC